MKLFPIVQIVQGSRGGGGGWHSLRKQPTFGDVTTGFTAKWRLRNERRNSRSGWVLLCQLFAASSASSAMFSVHLLLSAFILLCPFLCFALSCLLTLSDPVFRIYWFLPFGLQGAIICHRSMVSSPVLVYLELRSATLSITKKHALAKIYLQRHRFWVVNNVIFDTPQLQRKIRTSRPMQLPNYISVPSAPSLIGSLRKHPFLLALLRWGRFAPRNVCDSATEIPYWWRKSMFT